MSSEIKNQKRREYLKRTDNISSKKYEKTPKGFLMRLYRNMKSRITGVQKLKQHLYLNKDLLDKEDFYKWAFEGNLFLSMLETYKNSNYDRKLCPSIDRIDSEKGYTLENIRWLTHSENSRLGSLNNLKINGAPNKHRWKNKKEIK